MKRRLLFSAAALMMAAGLMAQTDITPKRFDFASQPVGEFKINGCCDGWGPQTETFEASKTMEGGGYVNITGSMPNSGNWIKDGEPTTKTIDFQKGLTIHDFGGKVGKVLVYKGHNCTNPLLEGVQAASGNITLGAPQLGFLPDYTKVETGSADEGAALAPYIRVSILCRAISNEAWNATDCAFKEFEVKTANSNVANVVKIGESLSNMDMMISPDDDDYTIEQGWVRVEFDFRVGLPEGNPFAFSLKFTNGQADMGGGEKAPFGWLDGGAFLVKELKFTQGVDGLYEKGKTPFIEKCIDLNEITGIASVDDENNEPSCTVAGDVLSVSNVAAGDKIEVYNTVGMRVASEVATADHTTLPLANKGLYIVSVNGKRSVKVFNN